MNKGGFAPLAVILVLAAAAIAGGFLYYVMQQPLQPVPTSSMPSASVLGIVTSPAPGEAWPINTLQKIKWSLPPSLVQSPELGGSEITLHLHAKDATAGSPLGDLLVIGLTPGGPQVSRNYFMWKVGAVQPLGAGEGSLSKVVLQPGTYWISVNNNTTGTIEARSADFQIMPSSTLYLPPIIIDVPTPNTTWGLGQTYKIQWEGAVPWNASGKDTNVDPGSFSLQLIASDGTSIAIASDTATVFQVSEGDVYSRLAYTYTVPANLAPGTYALVITQFLGKGQNSTAQTIKIAASAPPQPIVPLPGRG